MLRNKLKMTATEILKQAKEALINRDAVRCYNSGDEECRCTLCEIDRYIESELYPAEFVEWTAFEYFDHILKKWSIDENKDLTTYELYQYWIKNIKNKKL